MAIMAIEISIRALPASEIQAAISNLEVCTETDFAVRVFEKASVPYHKLRPNVVRTMAADFAGVRRSSGSTK
jgi:hypothetical protein